MAGPSIQVMPSPSGPNALTVNGRSYAGTIGTYQTVPLVDGEALIANNWITNCLQGCGATADRPTEGTVYVQTGRPGSSFFDTDLGALIAWDGVIWRNSATGAIA